MMTSRGFPVDSFPDDGQGGLRLRYVEMDVGTHVGNPFMHRPRTAQTLAASLIAISATLGGCASLLPIAGAIALREAADRYERSERASSTTPADPNTTANSAHRSARGTPVPTMQKPDGKQPRVTPPQDSVAAKAADLPLTEAAAEESATESSARILATAVKRVPTPGEQTSPAPRPARE